MQRFLSLFLALCLSLTFSLEASAKRLGSGSSSGSAPMHQTQSRSADSAPLSSPTSSTAQRPAAMGQQPAPTVNRPSGMSRWLGPLAGLAAGGLLASMFMGDGFEGFQFFDFLLLALIGFGIFFIVKRMMAARRQQPVAANLGNLGNPQAYRAQPLEPLQPAPLATPSSVAQPAAQPGAATNIFGQPISGFAAAQGEQRPFNAPAWFDEQRFIEAGRQHFLSLQQHWDAAEMDTIATFVTPSMLEFLKKERAALGDGFQSTHIENLAVYLDGIDQQDGMTIATLTFEGLSKSSRFDQGEQFSESWRMERRDGDNQPWLVAGIRQN